MIALVLNVLPKFLLSHILRRGTIRDLPKGAAKEVPQVLKG